MGDRIMKYPYTFTAKIAQFPYGHHFKHNPMYRFYIFGLVASFPFFVWVHNKVNSPAYVAQWKETQKKQAEKEAEHH